MANTAVHRDLLISRVPEGHHASLYYTLPHSVKPSRALLHNLGSSPARLHHGNGYSILYLYWLLGHYDCGLEPLVVLLC